MVKLIDLMRVGLPVSKANGYTSDFVPSDIAPMPAMPDRTGSCEYEWDCKKACPKGCNPMKCLKGHCLCTC